MDYQVIRGYICTDGERIVRRYIAPVMLVVLQFVACLFFVKAFQTSDFGTVLMLLICWIAFVVWSAASYFRVRVADRLAFSLEREKITNSWPKDNKIEIDLRDSYFCTIFTCAFAYGKASAMKSFYLFSINPFIPSNIKGQALRALESIHKSNIVIVPKTDEVEAWVRENLRLDEIPEYPSAVCKPSDWPWEREDSNSLGS